MLRSRIWAAANANEKSAEKQKEKEQEKEKQENKNKHAAANNQQQITGRHKYLLYSYSPAHNGRLKIRKKNRQDYSSNLKRKNKQTKNY